MKNAAEAIDNYYALRRTAFITVGLIELRQLRLADDRPTELMMELELLHNENDSRLRLSFAAVRQLIIRQPPWSLFQIGLLDIRSIKERQWEDLNYEVKSDDDEISFLCRSFDASLDTEETINTGD